MASCTAATVPFIVRNIVLIGAKNKPYTTSIYDEIHDAFLELNALLDETMSGAS